MAIAFDQALGTDLITSSSTTITLTTTNAVASGGFIVLGTAVFGGPIAAGFVDNVAGGGLTWTIDKQFSNSANHCIAIASAQAPSGLAASTVITVTYDNASDYRIVGAASFTGVATSSPVDGTPTGPTTVGTGAWATASSTLSAGSMLVAMSQSLAITGGNAPTSPSLEAWEITRLADDYGACVEYRIESSGGSYQVEGTWTGSSSVNAAVAYLAAAGGGGAEKQSFYAFRRRSVAR